MLCYEITDIQLIKSGHVHATVMYDCMQLKVKITDFQTQSKACTTETSLTFEY